MKITIITLFPNMVSGFFNESIIKRAREKKLVEIEIVNLRDFAVDSYGTVDDKPYGGGAGMILRIEPIYKSIQFAISNFKSQISNSKTKKILTSPRGDVFKQDKAREYSKLEHLIIIAGHYEGVDERVSDYIDEEISLGDFVMTGGEITAAAIVDAVARLLPGVLKKEEATQIESFNEVNVNRLIDCTKENELIKEKKIKKIKLLEYPQYTRPEEFQGKKVPEVLLSGNHSEINKWRAKKAYETTFKRRKDMLE